MAWLNFGHGGIDPGAVGCGLKEKDLTLKISLKIHDILLREYENVEVRMFRTTDVFLELYERARLANTWGADFLLSIHINATPSGYGYEDIIFNGTVSQRTVQIQDAINLAVIEATG
jgi:N-acetylmuramoyl-L-alanine amidase